MFNDGPEGGPPVADEDSAGPSTVWTIGHSNRTYDDFVKLLRINGVRRIADVRRFPGSRIHPQFDRSTLKKRLADGGVDYHHLPDLGGRRRDRREGSPNTGWRVPSFNAYADHMASPEFRAGIAKLEGLARERPTAIMCAEAVPWRCHRRLIADALLARGWRVRDVMGAGPSEPRRLTEFARVVDGAPQYPGPDHNL